MGADPLGDVVVVGIDLTRIYGLGRHKPRGWTPVSLVEYCRGHSIRVRVQAEGYATWAWAGLCPQRGALRLDAQLNPH